MNDRGLPIADCRLRSSANPQSAIRNPQCPRRAFTLVEAIVALTIMALAGSVLLLAAQTSLRTTDESIRRTIAEGLADQLLDEIVTKRFMETGEAANDTTLGAEGGETAAGRSLFDDTDDYHNLTVSPAQGPYGEELGTGDNAGGQRHPDFRISRRFFDNYRQRARVYYVDPTSPDKPLPQGQTSYYRGVEVAIDYVDPTGSEQELAVRRRVYAYIPPPP
jgi:type II secretory pathway pseudopilin PulG